MVIKNPHHVNPLEMVEAAVGLADLAWTAIEHHAHAQHNATATAWEDCMKLERELIHEKSENHRLKAALEELRKALHEVRSRDYKVAGMASTVTIEDACPLDLYERLQKKVDSPAFLERLKDMHEDESEESSRRPTKAGEKNVEGEDPSSWEMIPDVLFETEGREEFDGLDDEGFILLSQEDIIESLAAFVAKLVVSNPNAKEMSPTQIQEVISSSFAKMEGKRRLGKLWGTAKFIYSSLTWTTTVATTAVGLYKNPFIVKALFKALTMSSRLVVKVLV